MLTITRNMPYVDCQLCFDCWAGNDALFNNRLLSFQDEEKYAANEYARVPHYHPPDQVLLFDIEYEIW